MIRFLLRRYRDLFPPEKSVLAWREIARLNDTGARPVPKYPGKPEKLALRKRPVAVEPIRRGVR